jgi:hypothetical protein
MPLLCYKEHAVYWFSTISIFLEVKKDHKPTAILSYQIFMNPSHSLLPHTDYQHITV